MCILVRRWLEWVRSGSRISDLHRCVIWFILCALLCSRILTVTKRISGIWTPETGWSLWSSFHTKLYVVFCRHREQVRSMWVAVHNDPVRRTYSCVACTPSLEWVEGIKLYPYMSMLVISPLLIDYFVLLSSWLRELSTWYIGILIMSEAHASACVRRAPSMFKTLSHVTVA